MIFLPVYTAASFDGIEQVADACEVAFDPSSKLFALKLLKQEDSLLHFAWCHLHLISTFAPCLITTDRPCSCFLESTLFYTVKLGPRFSARSSRCSPRMLDILSVFCSSLSIGNVQRAFMAWICWSLTTSMARMAAALLFVISFSYYIHPRL